MRRHALVLFCVLASTAAATPQDYGLLRSKTDSDERWAPFHALKAQAPALAKAFAPHVYVNQKGERMPYRLFTPARLEPGRTYPLVVFLHGASGGGTDNAKQLEGGNLYGGLVWALRENQARHPSFVLAPQSDWNWPCTLFDPKNPPKIAADITLCPPEALGIGTRLAFEVIDSLLGTLPIDRSRLYVTGHSMGGAGSWHMLAHRPRFFAAAAPVCGRGHPETTMAFKDVAIWNFHGAKDEVEPVASSRAMIDALRKAGGQPRHTEYPDLGHNVFAWVYTEPALVEWLFAQKRDRPSAALERIDAWLAQETAAGRFSGAVLVADRGLPVYERAFGLADREKRIPNTPATPFNICSMGKMFTAAVVLLLADEGRLDVRAPIARYLPDFPRPAADRITLHHLLSHTSGLGNHMARPDFDRDARGLTTIESLYRRVREETPQFEAGARFSYSNSGFIVAGRIIERVTGQPYAEVVTRRLLAPLGMTATRFSLVDARPPEAARGYVPDGRGGFTREPTIVPQPASDGGVHSTVGDLLAFDRALHSAGLLSETARRLMQTPNLNGYGYGLSIKPPDEHVSRRTSVGHTGGLPDRSAVLRRFVGDEVTLIVLSNLPQAALTAVREIERLYFGLPPSSQVGR